MLICLVVVLLIQNAEIVNIDIFFWTIAVSRVLLMVILLAVGVLVGWFLKTYFIHREDIDDEE